MEYYSSIWMPTDSLAHYGIKGMKWGVRRWQNNDGSFNSAGKQRYFGNGSGAERYKLAKKEYKNANKEYKNSDEYKAARKERIKKAAKIGAAVAGTALVAYGAYKLNKMATDKLKAGDLYAAATKERWAGIHLNNYLTQMEIAINYKNTSSSNGTFDPQKYRRMIETANSAASRSTAASKEARSLLARRDSGNYSLRDKAETIYKMARRR